MNTRLAFAAILLASSFALTASAQERKLAGKRVAILVTDGFEQEELEAPRRALDDAGAKTSIVSPQASEVRGWKHTEWGDKFTVDFKLDEVKVDQFDALLLPGGVINPDKLRMNPQAVQFAKQFAQAGKPIAAICHGPWLLVEADLVRGHRVTSWPSLKTDLKNAGATWEDSPAVVDGLVLTSRKPDDIPAFNQQMILLFANTPTKSMKPETP